MTLNIHVEGDPGSMRATAAWTKSVGRRADYAADGVYRASTRAFDGWVGEGSSGFHRWTGQARPAGDAIAQGYDSLATAIDLHADDLATVNSRMQQAVGIALAAGLTVTDREILDPGPAPAEPQPVGQYDSPDTKADKGQA